ncbi:MAG: energy transducer TonB [Candidatus Aminicenantales bacterium]|jgi:protein TonB
MFHDSLFPRNRFFGNGFWAFPAALFVHLGIASLLVVIPLTRAGIPPGLDRIVDAFLTAPAPPPLPPPPPARHAGGRSGRIKPVQAAAFEAGRFVAPAAIPDAITGEPAAGGGPDGIDGGIGGGVPGGVWSGVVGPILNVLIGDVEAPVRATGDVRAPKLVRRVDPLYPEIARQARIEGVVIIEAGTDIYGRVRSARVLRSIPLLDQAALDAVRQWIYEPLVLNGRPRGVLFTVTVKFKLN